MEAVATMEDLDRILATSQALSQIVVIDWFAAHSSSPDGKSENGATSLRMLADRIRLKLRDLAGEEEKMLDDFARMRCTRNWTRMNTAALVMAS
ncbi:hypothetical protein ZIOFF_017975 [Zingiber officinale]|uniref:Uncharacterized protein n=1 Tax=Zingiber officinale TaxID=94328 RepID=A0A8J5HFV2_ZINOF|nr:hypothetical protein ZIOFF_017975 [Zingiber officinale]